MWLQEVAIFAERQSIAFKRVPSHAAPQQKKIIMLDWKGECHWHSGMVGIQDYANWHCAICGQRRPGTIYEGPRHAGHALQFSEAESTGRIIE
jgi:hypothetical protein